MRRTRPSRPYKGDPARRTYRVLLALHRQTEWTSIVTTNLGNRKHVYHAHDILRYSGTRRGEQQLLIVDHFVMFPNRVYTALAFEIMARFKAMWTQMGGVAGTPQHFAYKRWLRDIAWVLLMFRRHRGPFVGDILEGAFLKAMQGRPPGPVAGRRPQSGWSVDQGVSRVYSPGMPTMLKRKRKPLTS